MSSNQDQDQLSSIELNREHEEQKQERSEQNRQMSVPAVILGILRVLAIGVTGMAIGVLLIFIGCMIAQYGIHDLNERDYLNSQRYAQSLFDRITLMSSQIDDVKIYENDHAGGSVVSLDSPLSIAYTGDIGVGSVDNQDEPGVQIYQPTALTYEQFINDMGSFRVEKDENGTLHMINSEEEYHADWYSAILLSDYQIRSSDSYVVMPASAYETMAMQMMEPNSICVSDLSDEELLSVLLDRRYHSSLSAVENYLDKKTDSYSSYHSDSMLLDASNGTEFSIGIKTTETSETPIYDASTSGEEEDVRDAGSDIEVMREEYRIQQNKIDGYDDNLLRQIVKDVRMYDQYLFIDPEFSADSYTMTLEGFNQSLGFDPGRMTVVYSPSEKKFYSSYYGWYMIPEQLYFLREYRSADLGIYNSGAGEDAVVELDGMVSGEAMFWLPFADLNTLLRVKLGENYDVYLHAVRNLTNRQTNFMYYLENDSHKQYSNVDSIQEITGMDQYMIITRMNTQALNAALRNDTYENDAEHEYRNGFQINDQYGYLIRQINIENHHLVAMLNSPSLYQNLGLENLRMEDGDSLYLAIHPDYNYLDEFRTGNEKFRFYYRYMIPACILAVIMLVLTTVLVVLSVRKTGWGNDGQQLYFLDRWPAEIMWLSMVTSLCTVILLIVVIRDRVMFYMNNGWPRYHIIIFGISCAFCCLMIILGMTAGLSLLRRKRRKEYQELTIIRLIGTSIRHWMRLVAGQRNLVAQTVELYLVYWLFMIIGFMMVLFSSNVFVTLAGLILICSLSIGMLILSIRKAKGEQMIRTVTEELAGGNLEVDVPKGRPLEVERQILNNIEHLGDGLHMALEQNLYDERMKAELITNVSHDIKTPLTSIISYVDLLKREDIENEQARHYIEVLDQKSRRLKQLTEDLVEVSKISSGNIELECMPIDFGELVRQSIGEFQDKFEEHNLQTVDHITETPCVIYADGRRTYRVMENLLQNVCKYAMPGTRVYIDLLQSEEMMIFSIKNISQAELNIDAKELMERFIRGDQSRSTEGSGLGLSIAKDLVHMQNGTFDILLDGDLFKVTIMFPLVSGESKKN